MAPKGARSTSRKGQPQSPKGKAAADLLLPVAPGTGELPASAGGLVSRVALLSTAHVAPLEVFHRPTRRHRAHQVLLTGTGLLEYHAPRGEVEDRRRRPGKDARDVSTPEQGSDRGEETDEGCTPRSPISWARSTDVLEDAPLDERLPLEAEALLLQMRRRTARLKRQAAQWRSMFDPLMRAMEQAVSDFAGADGVPMVDATQEGLPRLDGRGAGGTGHPVARQLESLALGGPDIEPGLARAAELAKAEYLQQCQCTTGVTALFSALAIVRAAARCSSRAASRAVPGEGCDGEGSVEHQQLRRKQGCLESLRPLMARVLEGSGATRAESPEICAVALRHSHSRRAVDSVDGGLASVQHSLMSGAPASDAEGPFAKAAQDSHFTSMLTSTCLTEGQGESMELPFETATGTQRLQFWSSYFAYRALGAVSRELAVVRAQVAEADSFGRGRAAASKQPMLRLLRTAEAAQVDEHPAPLGHSSCRSTGTPRAQDDAGSAFPALGRHRSRPPQLAVLRRPPGATAVPLPWRERRPAKKDGEEEEEEVRASAVAAAGAAPAVLPPLTARERRAGRAKPAPGSPGERRTESAERDLSWLPKAPPKSQGLRLPMFVDTRPNSERSESPPVPFVGHGVGFELRLRQPGLPVLGALSPPSPVGDSDGKFSGRTVFRQAEPGPEDNRSPRSVAGNQPLAGALTRCAYCRHHGIEVQLDAPVATWRQRARVRHLQQRSAAGQARQSDGSTRLLCAACGGHLDTPFCPRNPLERFEEPKAPADGGAAAGGLPPQELRTPGRAEDEAPPEASAQDVSANAAMMLKHGAGTAFGAVPRGLSDAENAYFLACEMMHARPVAHAAATLMNSTSSPGPSLSSADAGGKVSPRGSIVASMRAAQLDDKGLAALLESLGQQPLQQAKTGSCEGLIGLVVHIDLAGNRITDAGAALLFDRLERPGGWARGLECLDLSGNRHITSQALAPLSSLLSAQRLRKLRVLRLGGLRLGDGFAIELLRATERVAGKLQELDISFLGLGRAGSTAPAAAAELLRQCSLLRVLDISGNHLQAASLAQISQALADAGGLQTLHIAHNAAHWPSPSVIGFGASQGDYDRARCQELPRSMRASSPSAAGTRPSKSMPAPPRQGGAMCVLWEHLPRMEHLKFLDLRESQVDPRSAFVIACALTFLPELEAVLLNGNPLGEFGVRALLAIAFLSAERPDETSPRRSGRFQRRNTIEQDMGRRLGVFMLDPCMEESLLAQDTPPVSPADPSGSYVFDMSEPYPRAATAYCMQRWRRSHTNVSFDAAFPYIDHEGKPYKEPSHGADGWWELPTTGTLSFSFLLPGTAEGHRRALSSELEQKALRIAAACGSPTSLMTVVSALAADFKLQPATARTLCCWLASMGAEGKALQRTGARLLLEAHRSAPAADTRHGGLELLEMLDPDPLGLAGVSAAIVRQLAVDARATLDFLVPENPTGRYLLNLAAPTERMAAAHLLAVNAWEVEVMKRRAMPDVSQAGTYHCFRNEAVDAVPFKYRADWVLPCMGMLQFDLAIPKRPPKAGKAIKEASCQRLRDALASSVLPVALRILCLRRISHRLYVTCKQVASLFEVLRVASASQGGGLLDARLCTTPGDTSTAGGDVGIPPLHSAVEAALLSVLFFRIKDYWQTDPLLFGQGAPLAAAERLRSSEVALGRLNVACPLQIHGKVFVLDLALHEDRQMLRLLLAVACKEGNKTLDPKCFPGCMFGPNRSELRPMTAPPLWWAKVGPPHFGIIEVMYAGEEGNARARRRLAHKFCGWDT